MALDPSIILQGRAPDILGTLTRSNEAAQMQRNNLRQRDIEQLYKTEGAGMLAGNQNSLNALAGFDPTAAQGIQQNQLGMDATRQNMAINAEELQMRRAEAKRLAEERIATKADNLTKEQAEAEAAKIERGVAAASTAQNPQQWDTIVQQLGLPDLVGQFANREAVIAPYLGVKDALDAFNPAPDDPTTSQRDYLFYAQQEAQGGRKPLSFNDWDLQSRKASATNVTVGGATREETSEFNKGVKSTNVNQVIDDIIATGQSATLPTTGFVGSKLSEVGGTAANDIAENIKTLQAAASFGSLQAMREASPTGAALGAVSDTEINLLSSELAALSQSQSQEQFFRNLERFRTVYNQIVNGPNAVPGSSSPPPTNLPPQIQALPPEVQSVFEKYRSKPGASPAP